MTDDLARIIAELRAKAEGYHPLPVPIKRDAILALLDVMEAARKMRSAKTSMDAALYGEQLDAALSALALAYDSGNYETR